MLELKQGRRSLNPSICHLLDGHFQDFLYMQTKQNTLKLLDSQDEHFHAKPCTNCTDSSILFTRILIVEAVVSVIIRTLLWLVSYKNVNCPVDEPTVIILYVTRSCFESERNSSFESIWGKYSQPKYDILTAWKLVVLIVAALQITVNNINEILHITLTWEKRVTSYKLSKYGS